MVPKLVTGTKIQATELLVLIRSPTAAGDPKVAWEVYAGILGLRTTIREAMKDLSWEQT